MSLKNLTVGSMVLMIILVIISLAANSAVDKSLENGLASDESTAGDQAMRAELPRGSVSMEDAQNNPGFLKTITEKFMQSVISMVDEENQQEQAGSSSAGSRITYDQLLEQYPLSEEELEQISKYSGDQSPVELIQSYCEDSQSPEFQEMIDSIKESYGNDPESPAMLMDMYSAMAEFCPD